MNCATGKTSLVKLEVQCSADTFVVKIAAFFKPKTFKFKET